MTWPGGKPPDPPNQSRLTTEPYYFELCRKSKKWPPTIKITSTLAKNFRTEVLKGFPLKTKNLINWPSCATKRVSCRDLLFKTGIKIFGQYIIFWIEILSIWSHFLFAICSTQKNYLLLKPVFCLAKLRLVKRFKSWILTKRCYKSPFYCNQIITTEIWSHVNLCMAFKRFIPKPQFARRWSGYDYDYYFVYKFFPYHLIPRPGY